MTCLSLSQRMLQTRAVGQIELPLVPYDIGIPFLRSVDRR
jgi:hypothetical protein